MAALDNSLVNAVLPIVVTAFGADVSAIEWVVTSYLLVQSALLLAFGRLGDMWGHKRVYLLGLGLVVASIIALVGAVTSATRPVTTVASQA